MPRVDAVSLEINANVAKFKQELEKLPGMTKKEAAKVARELSSGWKKAERAAKKSMKASQRSTTLAIEAIGSSIDRTMSELGGVFGDIGGKFFTLTESALQVQNAIGGLRGTAVAVGGAFSGATLAIGYAVGAAFEFVRSTDEMRESLEAFSGVDPVPASTLADLDAFTRSSDALEATWLRFKVLIAGEVSPALVHLSNTLVGVIGSYEEMRNTIDVILGPAIRFSEVVTTWPFMLVAAGVEMLGFADAGAQAASEITRLSDAQDEAAKSLTAMQALQRSAIGASEDLRYSAEGLEGAELKRAKAIAEAKKQASDAIAADKESAILANALLDITLRQIEADYSAARAKEDSAQATQAAAEAAREKAQADAEALAQAKSIEDAEASLVAIREKATEHLETRADAAIEAAQKEIDALDAVEKKLGRNFETEEARAEIRAALAHELGEIERSEIEQTMALEDVWLKQKQANNDVEIMLHQEKMERLSETLTATQAAVNAVTAWTSLLTDWSEQHMASLEAEAQEIKDAHKDWKQSKMEEIDAALAAGAINSTEAKEEKDRIRELSQKKREAMQDDLDVLRKGAKKEFRLQKSLAISEATMKALVAYQAMVIAFQFMGAGAPIAAAAATLVPLAAGIAEINAMKAPSFPTGGLVSSRTPGSPDHMMISAQPDEGIVTRRGMAMLGEDGLDALNTGRGIGGTTIRLELDRRTIASAVVSLVNSSSEVAAALDARSGTIAGRALVYGSG